MSFSGTYTALVTPFRDGEIDRDAFRALIDAQVEAGIDGIVPVGTTGESPTLSHDEHLEVVRLAVEFAAGRVEVVAGTGANSTREAIVLTRAAEQSGATGSRSVIEIAVDTVARLAADCPNIVAVKEAGGSVDRVNQLVEALPEGFSILSGDDPLTLPFMACGAVGLVSVAANLVPDVMARLVRACLNQSFDEALAIQKQYYPLLRGLMSLDTNPVPIKTALVLQGRCAGEFRLPLVPMNPAAKDALKELLMQFELI